MLGLRATRSADRSTRSRRPLLRDQSVSPPRVAPKKKSPVREPEEASRIEEKLEEKRTQLYDLLRSEQWPHAAAEEEVLQWQMTACVRRTGSWKGGIDLSYRHQDGTINTAWREVERRYHDLAPGPNPKRPRLASSTAAPSSSSAAARPTPPPSPPLPARNSRGSRRSRSELLGGEGDDAGAGYVLPPPPPPPPYIPLPDCGAGAGASLAGSAGRALERHRWRLAATLISLGCAPAEIKKWCVSVAASRGGPSRAVQVRYASPRGGKVCNSLAEVKAEVARAAGAAASPRGTEAPWSLKGSKAHGGGSGGGSSSGGPSASSTSSSKRVSASQFAALTAAAAEAAALEGSGATRAGTRRSNSDAPGRWATAAPATAPATAPAVSSRTPGAPAAAAAAASRSSLGTFVARGGSRRCGGSSDGEEGAPSEADAEESSSDDEENDGDDDEKNGLRALAALRLAVLEARLNAPPPDDDGGDDEGGGDDEASGGSAAGSGGAAAGGGGSSRRSSGGSGGGSSDGGGGGGPASPDHGRFGSAGAGPVVTLSDRQRLADLRAHGDGSLFAECVKVARLLARSRHAVCYTGAGISTGEGANLPTIRGKLGISAAQLKEEDFDPASISTLRPTRAHRALVALHACGVVRFVATQNIENLHRLSGLPDAALWEAHGNVCAAACPNCGKRFLRPPQSKMCDAGCWDPAANAGAARRSWRTGMLKRNVLSHYGARVAKPAAALAHVHAADVALIIGSSLAVQPFAKYASQPRKLAIVNLERTKSHEAEERARKHGARVLGEPCDAVLDAVLLLLGVPYARGGSSGEAVPANLPAFLEHGEESLDVAAIFMGGRRAYNKPRVGSDDGGGGGKGSSGQKRPRGRAPRLSSAVQRAGSDTGRSRRARRAALAGEGKEDEEEDALSSVDDNAEAEEEAAAEEEGEARGRSHPRRGLRRLEEFESSTEEEDDVILIDDEEEEEDEEGEAKEEEDEEVEEVEEESRHRKSGGSRWSPRGLSGQPHLTWDAASAAAHVAGGRSRSSPRTANSSSSSSSHSSSSSSSYSHSHSHSGSGRSGSGSVSASAAPVALSSSSSGGFVGFVKSVIPWA